MKLPTFFVSHGAPTFAVDPGRMGPVLAAAAEAVPAPKAILVVSAHWETPGIEVMSHPTPPTVHDFGGFPEDLYALRYPAPGSPEVAQQVLDLLAAAGLPARANQARGLDHGAWVPLMHMFPEASLPVLQLSLPRTASPEVLWGMGDALQSLRDAGILFVASGGIAHNLYEFRMGVVGEESYAREFMEWFASRIASGDKAALLDYRRQAPHAVRAHPTDEHLRPIFVALGAAGEAWTAACRFHGGIDFGVIGMDAYAFGLSSALHDDFQRIAAPSSTR